MKNEFATHWQQAVPLPINFRGRSRSILRSAIISTAYKFYKNKEDNYLRCLFCHYVFDNQIKEFDRIISELKCHGEFVNTDQCMRMLRGEMEIDRKYYHLSFDDGFRNNYTNALPILKKHGVPAIFFVPSSIIESSFEKTREYCLNAAKYRCIIEMMNWDNLAALVSDGYEVGSHTKTHAILSDISNNRHLLEDEILGSKIEIEDRLNIECKYIAWPFGKDGHFDRKSMNMADNAGYAACFSTNRGSIQPGITDVFSIPRHHFEVQWPLSHIEYFASGNMEAKR